MALCNCRGGPTCCLFAQYRPRVGGFRWYEDDKLTGRVYEYVGRHRT